MHKLMRVGIAIFSFAVMNHADAWFQLNTTGVKVTKLHVRTALFTAASQWFGITLDSTVTMSCPGIGPVTTSVVVIPMFVLESTFSHFGQSPNLAYQDYVSSATLAFTQQRPVLLYADGCLDGHPRIVGMDILQS